MFGSHPVQGLINATMCIVILHSSTLPRPFLTPVSCFMGICFFFYTGLFWLYNSDILNSLGKMANMSSSLVFRSFGWNPQSHTEHQREVYLIWSSCPYRLLKTVLEQEKVFNAKSWDQMCEQRVSAKHVFKMPSPKQPSFGHRQKLCPNHPACQPIWSLLPCHWLCSQSWACPPALRSHTSDWRTTWATAGV